MILLIIAGFVSGIISGMGIGGGTVLIPVLTIFMGIDQRTAQCINLLYFIPTAAVSLFFHIKNKNIEAKNLFDLIIFGCVFAALGAFITKNIENDMLRRMFGILLFIMGVSEIFSCNFQKDTSKTSTNLGKH